MAPAAAKAGAQGASSDDDYLARLEQASIANSLDNLMTFPGVRTAIGEGRITLHGAYFGVATGALYVRDPATGAFVCIASG